MRYLSIKIAILSVLLPFAIKAMEPTSEAPKNETQLNGKVSPDVKVQMAFFLTAKDCLVFGGDAVNTVDCQKQEVIPVAQGINNDWYSGALVDYSAENKFCTCALTSVLNPGVSIINIDFANEKQYINFIKTVQIPPNDGEEFFSHAVAGGRHELYATHSRYEREISDEQRASLPQIRDMTHPYVKDENYRYTNCAIVNYWKDIDDLAPSNSWRWNFFNVALFPLAMSKQPNLAAVCMLKDIYLLDPRDKNPVGEIAYPYGFPAASMAFSDDGSYICLGGSPGLAYIFDVRQRKKLHDLYLNSQNIVSAVRFTPDSKELIGGSILGSFGKSNMVTWDVSSGKEIKNVEIPLAHANTIAISGDAHYAVAGGHYGCCVMQIKKAQSGSSAMAQSREGFVEIKKPSANGEATVPADAEETMPHQEGCDIAEATGSPAENPAAAVPGAQEPGWGCIVQ